MSKTKLSSREIVQRLQMIEASVAVPLIPEPGKVGSRRKTPEAKDGACRNRDYDQAMAETVMAYPSLTPGGTCPDKIRTNNTNGERHDEPA